MSRRWLHLPGGLSLALVSWDQLRTSTCTDDLYPCQLAEGEAATLQLAGGSTVSGRVWSIP